MDKTITLVLDKIEQHNFKAYLVGGYVRDYLRKKLNLDIDITTNATPKDLMEIFKECKVTPLDYGNVIVNINGVRYEITTFRRDISYKDNRKACSIEYVDTLEEDIKRRDFTINTICMDKNGQIIDLLNGKKDLHKKLIRSVGDPYFKTNEDVLRILRAVRFACCLNFKIDNELKAAIIKNKELLKNLSYERKKEELTKIFTSENKKYGVKLLKDLGLVEVLDLHDIDKVLLTNDPIGIWSLIIDDNTYPFTKNEKEIIDDIKSLMNEDINNNYIKYKYGSYILSIVCDLKKLNKHKIIKQYERLPIQDRNEIKITANEIITLLNKEPGSYIKDIFDDLELKILNGDIKNTQKDIYAYLKNNRGLYENK